MGPLSAWVPGFMCSSGQRYRTVEESMIRSTFCIPPSRVHPQVSALMAPLIPTFWRFLKKLKIELPYYPAMYQEKTGHVSRENSNFKRHMLCSQLHYLQQPRQGSNINVHQLMKG